MVAAKRLIEGENDTWDLINLNNPFARELLYPRGLIQPLAATRFAPAFERMLSQFSQLYRCAYSQDGSEILGICQSFGPFNLVIDTHRIASHTAEAEGFDLMNDPANKGYFGILAYDDFNIFHVCIGANLDPFEPMDEKSLDIFEETARRWHSSAYLVTSDHSMLNRALLDGRIRCYVSGGTYTVAHARLAGHKRLRAVTPRQGPIKGRGGIVFMEVTSILRSTRELGLSESFLEYLVSYEGAVAVAMAGGGCIPIAQMADPTVMRAYTREHLDAIQWDTLEEEISRCAEYAVAPSYKALHARLVAARGAVTPVVD